MRIWRKDEYSVGWRGRSFWREDIELMFIGGGVLIGIEG